MRFCQYSDFACDKAIGVPKEYAKETISVSFGVENIEKGAEAIADSLIDILNMNTIIHLSLFVFPYIIK
jgi:hypothetical protein